MIEFAFTEKGLQARIVRNGATYVKPVAVKDFAAKLSNGISVDFGLLPANCRTVCTVGPHHIVGVELAPLKATVSVSNDRGTPKKIADVALPASYFVFVLTKAGEIFRQSTAYAFALENDRIVLPKDKLFKLPVPNIYNVADNKDNQICWGATEMYDLQSLTGIEMMVKAFFSAPFNSDLFGIVKTSPKFPWDKISNQANVEEYFKLLSGQPEFKREWLAPCSAEYATWTTAINTITSSLR